MYGVNSRPKLPAIVIISLEPAFCESGTPSTPWKKGRKHWLRHTGMENAGDCMDSLDKKYLKKVKGQTISTLICLDANEEQNGDDG